MSIIIHIPYIIKTVNKSLYTNLFEQFFIFVLDLHFLKKEHQKYAFNYLKLYQIEN